MIRKEGKEGKVERRGRVEVVLQESAAIWRQNLHKSSLSSHFFGAGTEFYFIFSFFFPPSTYWRSVPFVGVLGFMTQDSISQRSPPLGEY